MDPGVGSGKCSGSPRNDLAGAECKPDWHSSTRVIEVVALQPLRDHAILGLDHQYPQASDPTSPATLSSLNIQAPGLEVAVEPTRTPQQREDRPKDPGTFLDLGDESLHPAAGQPRFTGG